MKAHLAEIDRLTTEVARLAQENERLRNVESNLERIAKDNETKREWRIRAEAAEAKLAVAERDIAEWTMGYKGQIDPVSVLATLNATRAELREEIARREAVEAELAAARDRVLALENAVAFDVREKGGA